MYLKKKEKIHLRSTNDSLSMAQKTVYGIHPVEELVRLRPNEVEHIYFVSTKKTGSLFELLKLCRRERLPYSVVPPQKLDFLASTNKHQGVVALCPPKAYIDVKQLRSLFGVDRQPPPLLLVAASVEDPRNLGAIIRSSVAFGVDAILLEKSHTALLGAAVAKASTGMLEHIPFCRPNNLIEVIREFLADGYGLVGACSEANKKPHEIDFKRPIILVSGGEHRGIPPYIRKECSQLVRIPISKNAGSLNVSAAVSILLYECARQRGFFYQASVENHT